MFRWGAFWGTRPMIAAVLGAAGSTAVVAGGALAGASGAAPPGRLWTVPSVPVTPPANALPGLVLFYAGLIVLVRAWFLLRRTAWNGGLRTRAILAICALWAIPMLVGPPIGSRDVYAYAAQGQLASEGHDVYVEGPSALGADDPVLEAVDPLYLDTPVLYGPLFVALSAEVADRYGSRLVTAVLAFRALAVAGLLVASAAVWDIARRLGREPTDALILVLANPLVLLHLVSGAHNEAIMLGLLLAGIAIGLRTRVILVGVALVGLAAAIKVPAALGVAYLGWVWAIAAPDWRRSLARMGLVGAEGLLVVALAGRLTGWGWGWVDAATSTTPVDAYLSVTRVAGGTVSLLTGLDAADVLAVARLMGLVSAVAISLLLLVRYRHAGPAVLAWMLVVWAVLHPTTQPWYLTWGVVLAAATSGGRRSRSLVVLCAVSVFVVLPIGPQLGRVVTDNFELWTLIVVPVGVAILTASPAPRRQMDSRVLRSDLVSIVVPVRHEAANIGPMVERVTAAMSDRQFELLFVDDSDDETPAVVSEASETWGDHVRLLHRQPDQRWGGLGGAVVDGFGAARGAVAVVLDGDLQHPPERIPDLVDAADRGADLVVGSRRVPGGDDGDGLSSPRLALSRLSTNAARSIFPGRVGPISDPMSGFFAVRLGKVDLGRLGPDGFKILLEVLATHPELTRAEVPFRFEGRAAGETKASFSQGLRYGAHLCDLRVRATPLWAGASSRYAPARPAAASS